MSANATATKKPRGRLFFANPGPTNIPDSILHAVAHHTVDFHNPDFLKLYDECIIGLKQVLGTTQNLFMYTASGHGAWEASLVNLFSPGETLLIPETGNFSESWGKMAQGHGLNIQTVPCQWDRGVEYDAIRDALAADTARNIKAVCVVHNETSTGMFLRVDLVRKAVDEAGHPALILVDTISSLGSLPFQMDAWGVDVAVGGSQKGLMLPTGMSFTGVSDKAMAVQAQSKLNKNYFDWAASGTRRQKGFVGTVPVTLFYGLKEALRLMEEEGMENVFARHHRLAEAVRRCVRHWSGNNGPRVFCTNPGRESDSVTAVLMPEGFDAEAIRKTTLERYNVSLGGGLSKLNGKVFRIGHLGDLNEPMILGTLAAVEMALAVNGVPHAKGGVGAAMEYLAAN